MTRITSTLVVFHGGCPDGFTAAWVVAKAKPGCELHAAMYGKPPPDVNGRNVYIVDFSYSLAVMEDICDRAESVTLLDHHKTALDDLADLRRPNLCSVLDMDRSGARIAWDYFRDDNAPPVLRLLSTSIVRDDDPPPVLLAIEDRDLWRFALPGTAEMFATATSYPYDLSSWDRLMDMTAQQAIEEGTAINRYRDQQIALVVANARRGVVAGHNVPVVNSPYFIGSDVAGKLDKGEPFAAYYFDSSTERRWGLRSAPDGLDVAKIAESLGGGGHPHAAGFTTDFRFTADG